MVIIKSVQMMNCLIAVLVATDIPLQKRRPIFLRALKRLRKWLLKTGIY